jgi:hypothetical protein
MNQPPAVAGLTVTAQPKAQKAFEESRAELAPDLGAVP